MAKNASCNLQKVKVTSSTCLFCLTNSPKPRNIQFTIIKDKKEQQILIFEKLEL